MVEVVEVVGVVRGAGVTVIPEIVMGTPGGSPGLLTLALKDSKGTSVDTSSKYNSYSIERISPVCVNVTTCEGI